MALDKQLYSNFFKNKSIQRTDKFLVTIIPDVMGLPKSSRQQHILDVMNRRTGPMPKIEGHHVVNITSPTWEFKKESSGWNSFPAFEFNGGHEFSIMFEEDRHGTIANFVNYLQRKICDDSGYHFPTHLNRIGSIVIEVYSEQDVPIYAHRYSNCYFLRSTPITYDYTSTVAQKISITFGSESHLFYTNEKDKIDTEKGDEQLSFTGLLKKTFL